MLSLLDCGGVLTNPIGWIMSPSFPANYPSGSVCAWKIEAPEGSRVRVGDKLLNRDFCMICILFSVNVFLGLDDVM